MTTIADQANEIRAAAAKGLPAEVVAAFAADQAALEAAGVPAGAVSVGDTIAPFALPDASGHTRTLDELTADGPAVIVFYRGGWCPYCNVTLRTYERELLPELDAVFSEARRDLAGDPGRLAHHTGESRADLHRPQRYQRPARLNARNHLATLAAGPRRSTAARRRHPHHPRRPGHHPADAERPDRRPRRRRAIR